MIFCYYMLFVKSLNARFSLAGMISLLSLATSVLGFSTVIPIAAGSSPIDDTTTGSRSMTTTSTPTSENISSNAATTTSTTTTTPRVELADEPFAVGHYRTTEFNDMTSEGQIQFTFEGNTTITLPNSTETITTRDTGQGNVTFLPGGGGSTIRAQIHMTTEDGSESATGDVSEFFNFESSTGVGVAYFSTNSTSGMLAPLNNMIAVLLDEVQPNEDSIVRFFEWKRDGGSGGGGAAPST